MDFIFTWWPHIYIVLGLVVGEYYLMHWPNDPRGMKAFIYIIFMLIGPVLFILVLLAGLITIVSKR